MSQVTIPELKIHAHGSWREILTGAGLPVEFLDGRGHPCPLCGGRDRFAVFHDIAEARCGSLPKMLFSRH